MSGKLLDTPACRWPATPNNLETQRRVLADCEQVFEFQMYLAARQVS